MLRIEIGDYASKFLRRLQKKQAGQIGRKIRALAENPYPSDSKQLKGSIWRGTNIGEYRVIYGVQGESLIIPLIGKRNDDEVYHRLKRLEGS